METIFRKISKCSSRTLFYYQCQGGIYNDIITVLTRIKNTHEGRDCLQPYKVLNYACEVYEACLYIKTEDRCGALWDIFNSYLIFRKIQNSLRDDDKDLILFAVFALCTQEPMFVDVYLPEWNNYLDKRKHYCVFKQFINDLLEKNMKSEMFFEKKMEYRLAMCASEYSDIIAAKETHILELKNKLEEVRHDYYEASRRLSNLENVPRLDKVVTFTTAKEYMMRMRKYERVNQILEMVQELTRGITTDQEEKEIRELKDYLLNETPKNITYINNNRESIVMQGIMNIEGFPIGTDPKAFIDWAIPAYKKYLDNER